MINCQYKIVTLYVPNFILHTVTNCRIIELSSNIKFIDSLCEFPRNIQTYCIQTFTKVTSVSTSYFIISTIQAIKFIGNSSMFNVIPSYPSYTSFVGTRSYVLQFPPLIVRPTAGLDILSCRGRLLANSSIYWRNSRSLIWPIPVSYFQRNLSDTFTIATAGSVRLNSNGCTCTKGARSRACQAYPTKL